MGSLIFQVNGYCRSSFLFYYYLLAKKGLSTQFECRCRCCVVALYLIRKVNNKRKRRGRSVWVFTVIIKVKKMGKQINRIRFVLSCLPFPSPLSSPSLSPRVVEYCLVGEHRLAFIQLFFIYVTWTMKRRLDSAHFCFVLFKQNTRFLADVRELLKDFAEVEVVDPTEWGIDQQWLSETAL